MIKIEIYPDTATETRWRAIDTNGRNIANGGEGYDDEDNAEAGFENLANHIKDGDYEVVRVTTK